MKACAFCGGNDCHVLTIQDAYTTEYQGCCRYCGAKTAPCHTREAAVKRWDMRGDDFRPKDRKLLCAREALSNTAFVYDPARDMIAEGERVCIRAIELWEEGFGK